MKLLSWITLLCCLSMQMIWPEERLLEQPLKQVAKSLLQYIAMFIDKLKITLCLFLIFHFSRD